MSQDDNAAAAKQQGVIDSTQTLAQTKEEKEQQRALGEYSSQKTGTDRLSMHVKIYSPFRDYYDGQAFSLSAENATGPFDILPKHHSFISLLNACDIVIRTVDRGEQRVRISGGIIHVKADEVIVFLDV